MVPPPRIVSLLPSATEIICALGLADSLVGVTHECDHPAAVVGKPILTASRISHETMTSAEIDHAVRSQLDGHGSTTTSTSRTARRQARAEVRRRDDLPHQSDARR